MDFIEVLQETIDKWREDPIEDEWVFENFRKIYIEQMSPENAFTTIDQVMPFLLSEEDESTSIELVETILELARKSNTTQVPKAIYTSIDQLRSLFRRFGEYTQGKLDELFGFYRI